MLSQKGHGFSLVLAQTAVEVDKKSQLSQKVYCLHVVFARAYVAAL